MDVTTMSMPANQARIYLEQYRDSMAEKSDYPMADLDTVIKQAYGKIAEGKRIIDLHGVMRETGLNEDGLPKLAIARATSICCQVRIQRNGGATFFSPTPADEWGRAPDGRRRFNWASSTHVSKFINLPAGTYSPNEQRSSWATHQALTPYIPPRHRPSRGIRNYHVLWEAVWEPVPPIDPFLIRHLAGSLYVVLAEWDLTPLEQAALAKYL